MRQQTEFLRQKGLIGENRMREMEKEIEELWNEGVAKLVIEGRFDDLQKLQSDFLHRNLRFGGEVTKFGKS